MCLRTASGGRRTEAERWEVTGLFNGAGAQRSDQSQQGDVSRDLLWTSVSGSGWRTDCKSVCPTLICLFDHMASDDPPSGVCNGDRTHRGGTCVCVCENCCAVIFYYLPPLAFT